MILSFLNFALLKIYLCMILPQSNSFGGGGGGGGRL
jgi:hypothetical protein